MLTYVFLVGDVLFGDEYMSVFNKTVEDFLLNDAGEKLEVLKRDYLGQ